MIQSAINQFLDIREEDLPNGISRLHLKVRPEFFNEGAIPHGGIVALLLDGAMGRTALRSLAQDETAATVQLSIQYLRPAEGLLTAEAQILRRGRGAIFMQAQCHNDAGKLIATAHGTWFVKKNAS